MDRLMEAMDLLKAIMILKEQEQAQKRHEAIMANFAKIKGNLDKCDSCHKQNISTDECGKSIEEQSMKEILESQLENKEMEYVLQQVEEAKIIKKEEVQVASPTIEDDSIPTNVLFEIVEPSSLCYEIDDKEDHTQPPTHDLSNKECVEEVGEQGIEIGEACQEVEVIQEEEKKVIITLPKPVGASLTKQPSIILFEWAKFITLSFIVPFEYALLETNAQLRTLFGLKSKRELCSG
ncbi:hypothetical protein Ahy_A08g038222 [Arachis hypogaea]|uniref:Uncharacterized protein n=1 Tax=Arachis hypogaea TaxID=3818 RepID=A0A445BT69_ARAHY|nr:hypothetical protein Ahy_A08g038222 [Arachis hypogaea]